MPAAAGSKRGRPSVLSCRRCPGPSRGAAAVQGWADPSLYAFPAHPGWGAAPSSSRSSSRISRGLLQEPVLRTGVWFIPFCSARRTETHSSEPCTWGRGCSWGTWNLDQSSQLTGLAGEWVSTEWEDVTSWGLLLGTFPLPKVLSRGPHHLSVPSVVPRHDLAGWGHLQMDRCHLTVYAGVWGCTHLSPILWEDTRLGKLAKELTHRRAQRSGGVWPEGRGKISLLPQERSSWAGSLGQGQDQQPGALRLQGQQRRVMGPRSASPESLWSQGLHGPKPWTQGSPLHPGACGRKGGCRRLDESGGWLCVS